MLGTRFFRCGGAEGREDEHRAEDLLGAPLNVAEMTAQRLSYIPPLPRIFSNIDSIQEEEEGTEYACAPDDTPALSELFKTTWANKIIRFTSPLTSKTPSNRSGQSTPSDPSGRTPRVRPITPHGKDGHQPLRVGVVLSGGQAPGGHSVVAGIYDFVKNYHPDSILFGFLNGPRGIVNRDFIPIDDDLVNKYRHMGGFDMLRSGRDKISTDEEKQASLDICTDLNLDSLIIIGGDDSNTNGLILGEFFASTQSKTVVLGVPKTIDGDLRNDVLETSFGFDTAAKNFAESISNLMLDVRTTSQYYHFIRVMGRNASHLAFECALQCHPNMVLIGEEMQEKEVSLGEIVSEICDMIEKRWNQGLNHGVIIIPEGLVEFVPDFVNLMKCLNKILLNHAEALEAMEKMADKLSYVTNYLETIDQVNLFNKLPSQSRRKLLFDRDPHGNIQVSQINTEYLIMHMVGDDLRVRQFQGKYRPQAHFMGYEGRCVMPSNFDTCYSYSLGYTAGLSSLYKLNGYCVCVKNLIDHDPNNWVPGAIPLTSLVHKELRNNKIMPVIKKYMVDTTSRLYEMYLSVRDQWKYDDYYHAIGPIQYYAKNNYEANYQIRPPLHASELLISNFATSTQGHQIPGVFTQAINHQISDIIRDRDIYINSSLKIPARPAPHRDSARDTSKEALTHPTFKKGSPKDTSQATIDTELDRATGAAQGPSHINLGSVLLDRAHVYDTALCELLPYQTQSEGVCVLDLGTPHCDGAVTVQEEGSALVVGVCLCGDPAPGGANVLVGLYENVARMGGTLYGFKGVKGLLESNAIELTDSIVYKERNQAAFTLLGRTGDYEQDLASQEGMHKIFQTTKNLELSTLILLGGPSALGKASVLVEYMTSMDSSCGVNCVPLTGMGDMDVAAVGEVCGYDTQVRTCSGFLGSLAVDNISSSKYYYIVRLPGRSSSRLAMDVSLEVNPTHVVVSEECRALNKTLNDVVEEIARLVVDRHGLRKAHGVIVIPESLCIHLADTSRVIEDCTQMHAQAMFDGRLGALVEQVQSNDEFWATHGASETNQTYSYVSRLSSKTIEFLAGLSSAERMMFAQPDRQKHFRVAKVSMELIIGDRVKGKIDKLKSEMGEKIPFSPLCFYFGYQTRGAYPTPRDRSLGYSHGLAAGKLAAGGYSGYFTYVSDENRNYPNKWITQAKPLPLILTVIRDPDTPTKKSPHNNLIPRVILPPPVLNTPPFAALQESQGKRAKTETYRSPGPVQLDLSRLGR